MGTVETTAEADFDRVYRVNVKGCSSARRPRSPIILKGGGGVILNMASIAALIGIPDRFAYSMSKGAVLSMTTLDRHRLHEEEHPLQLHLPRARAHAVRGRLPGPHYPGREQEMFQELSAYQPLGRMGTPEEVAHMALYLCSDEASFITGQAYPHRRRSAGDMKLIRFGDPGREKPGLQLEDGTRIDASAFGSDYDEAFFGGGGLARLREWSGGQRGRRAARGRRRRAWARRCARPSKIVCIGLNYRDHAAETGAQIPKEPVIFFKATTVAGGTGRRPGDPARREKVDWEVELAVVIGARALATSPEDARARHVAGYALHNDYSERSFQLERGGQWVEGQERGHLRAARARSWPRATRSRTRRRCPCG